MNEPRVKLSKFLALVLRHKADEFGLQLDEEGFTDADQVWTLVQNRYPGRYTWADFEAVITGDAKGKKRYELRDGRVRALFGHSEVRPIHYEPAVPPETLYHGTTDAALDAIRRDGLRAMARQYVHLTTSMDRAVTVGHRHSSSVIILTIRAREAHACGITFYHPEPEHFLAASIPPEFIDAPER